MSRSNGLLCGDSVLSRPAGHRARASVGGGWEDGLVTKSTSSSAPRRTPYLAAPGLPGWHHLDLKGGVSIDLPDPYWTSEETRRAARRAAAQARMETEGLTRRLIELLHQADAISVYVRLVTQEQLGRLRHMEELAGYEGAVEFLGGLVTSLDVEAVTANRSLPVSQEVVREVDFLLREIASRAPLITAADLDGQSDERHVEERYQLLLEKMYDRMAGYPQHLRAIDLAVLNGIDRECACALGFRPTRALELAAIHTKAIEGIRMQALSRLRDRKSCPRPSWHELVDAFAEAAGRDPASTVAAEDGWSSDEVTSILTAMATPVGSQDVTSLLSPNRLRCFPVIQTPDGYVWPHPEDFIHEAPEWIDALLLAREALSLRERLSVQRARITEQLVADRLVGVFGASRVSRGVKYAIGKNQVAETDVIVDLGTAAIVVEAKAHRITAQGRAGHVDRVRTKFRELVEAPIRQSARARDALLAGASFRNAPGQARIRQTPRTEVARVVVTLDRIDPFAAVARDGDLDGPGDVWMVSLADFLAVMDTLCDPTAVYAYIQTRMAQTAAQSPLIGIETDALGAWLRTREGVWPLLAGSAGRLAYSSKEINAFFTLADQHERLPGLVAAPPRPSLGVPSPILDLMIREMQNGHPLWPTAAKSIFDVRPECWRPIHRQLQQPRRPTTRTQRRAARRAARGRALSGSLHLDVVEPGTPEILDGMPDGRIRIQVQSTAAN